ncbi:unnamed protein product [Clonostachys byssicola]|uniref:Uncharacterized protein n=1 Tax=Clonostachys byssicola TaxID=160290 RepID=A0A9N9Y0Q9_9HYPO|nr:unnamed protein product [Clonostachys byssicola]
MRAHIFIASALVAFAAAIPMEARQCAGCEPSGKGASSASGMSEANPNATSSSNASNNNTNNNSISLTLPSTSGSNGSPSGSNGGDGGNNQPPTNSDGEEKGTCKACIDFCTGRADLLDGLCKVIVCGIDCVLV